MTNYVEQFEKNQVERLLGDKVIPDFKAGDTLRVHVRIATESNKNNKNTSRIQIYEGLCIARRNRGFNSSYTVRKISNGEGIERTFPLYSPVVEKIERIREGDVRRAKLYYMRERTGKAARIREKTYYHKAGAAKQDEQPQGE
ncbi:MAG: 50S ribosomal protein L19 [Rickettsiales bacterium]